MKKILGLILVLISFLSWGQRPDKDQWFKVYCDQERKIIISNNNLEKISESSCWESFQTGDACFEGNIDFVIKAINSKSLDQEEHSLIKAKRIFDKNTKIFSVQYSYKDKSTQYMEGPLIMKRCVPKSNKVTSNAKLKKN